MKTYFEIVDEKGVVESPLTTEAEALEKLHELNLERFEFEGTIKIVEVHYTYFA